MKTLLITFILLFSNVTFGQLVSPNHFDIVLSISENGHDYMETVAFYKKDVESKHFTKTDGIHERLLKPRKDVTYFTEYIKNDTQIAIYFFMPFQQKASRDLGIEMYFVNQIQFDVKDLATGTYFINYAKDLHFVPNSYKVNPTGEGLLVVSIPSKTLERCKISKKFISSDNYSDNKN